MKKSPLVAGQLRHDFSATFEDRIGGSGLSVAALQTLVPAAARSLEGLRQKKKSGALPLLSLPWRRDDLQEGEALAAELRSWARHVLVLGIGGSSLGGATRRAGRFRRMRRNCIFLIT